MFGFYLVTQSLKGDIKNTVPGRTLSCPRCYTGCWCDWIPKNRGDSHFHGLYKGKQQLQTILYTNAFCNFFFFFPNQIPEVCLQSPFIQFLQLSFRTLKVFEWKNSLVIVFFQMKLFFQDIISKWITNRIFENGSGRNCQLGPDSPREDSSVWKIEVSTAKFLKVPKCEIFHPARF